MTVTIRHARPDDHSRIAAVTAAAFGQPHEARLVERLRADGDVLFELVATAGDELTGHILFSRLWADREPLFAALAPVSVHPAQQRIGIGSVLVRAGLVAAREFGAHGVLVLGHPEYYPRFGFSRDAARHVDAPYAALTAFMAMALEPGAFDTPLKVAYPAAFSD